MATTPPSGPSITVAVLSYNHSIWIEECLESIKRQRSVGLHLLVIDDASTDASATVIRQWVEKHWPDAEVRLHSENRGLVERANEALDLVSTVFYQLIGSDDALVDGKLALQLETMARDPEVALCFTDMTVVDDEGNEVAKSMVEWQREKYPTTPLPSADKPAAQLLLGASYCAPSWIVRTEAARLVGGYDRRFHQEDVPFFLKIATRFRVAQIDQPLVRYRRHAESISMSGIPNSATSIVAWCDLLLSLRTEIDDDDAWLPQYRRRTRQLIATRRSEAKRFDRIRHAVALARHERGSVVLRLQAYGGVPLALLGLGLKTGVNGSQ